VFLRDEDRQIYLALLREYSLKYEVGIIGFCLMTNHIHLIAVPQGQTSLAKALGRTHSDYAAGGTFAGENLGTFGKTGSSPARCSLLMLGLRSPMSSEIQFARDSSPKPNNGNGAAPEHTWGSANGQIGWRCGRGQTIGHTSSGARFWSMAYPKQPCEIVSRRRPKRVNR
jgi:hypothetical protein